MTKMKVHELAKELQKQSKEILAFLQEQLAQNGGSI